LSQGLFYRQPTDLDALGATRALQRHCSLGKANPRHPGSSPTPHSADAIKTPSS